MKVVDTTFLIDYYRERDAIEQYLDAHDEETIAASTITFGELAVGEIMARDETKREILADLGWLDVRAFTIEHAYDAAAIEADLRDRGEYRATSANDIEIGGTARALGVPIVTRNVEDFERFDGVVVETY
jgi:predicted nucleic acid-binding protein